ncbi:MAG TPA: hypothetical protein VJ742_08490, partial [Nitrososphaera sp.]|nr:hypothetical protein [Nitrososphaera sp.]
MKRPRDGSSYGIAAFLDVAPEEVQITSVSKGSVKVEVEIPANCASRLLNAYQKHGWELNEYLNSFNVEDVALIKAGGVRKGGLRMRYLTDRELETFRRDYQDKEREIQRYIAIYLSGLVLVTGWIIGPQSRPLLVMALGNSGYNLYAFLIFVVLNIVFTNFLIYKSIIIHEITQFMTVVAKPDSGFVYWDSWRRSPQSATKPVR